MVKWVVLAVAVSGAVYAVVWVIFGALIIFGGLPIPKHTAYLISLAVGLAVGGLYAMRRRRAAQGESRAVLHERGGS